VKPSRLFETLCEVLEGRASTSSRGSHRKPVDRALSRRIPLRALVSDEDPVSRKIAARILERMGYRAEAVGSGPETLELIRRQGFDLLFLDVEREPEGVEWAARIAREVPRERRPRVVAMAAEPVRGAIAKGAVGIDDWVRTPLRAEDVQDAIERCGRERARRSPSSGHVEREGLPPLGVLTAFHAGLDDGEPGLARDAMEAFLSDARDGLRQIREAVERGDAVAVERSARAFRASGGALVGDSAAYSLFGELERRGRAGSLDGSLAVIGEIEGRLERLGGGPPQGG
jgi:CheY-like chemotaxis protein